MIVDLVQVTTRDGIRLDGTWRQPPLGHAAQLGVDVVILHHGVGGNFYSPGMFEQMFHPKPHKSMAVKYRTFNVLPDVLATPFY